MKRIMFLLLIALTGFSCSKEKKALKKLDGTWVMTKSTYQDTGDEDLTGIRRAYTFDKCKSKEMPCPGTFVYQVPQYSQDLQWSITYSISESADKLTIVRTPTNFQGSVQTIVYEIIQLDKEFMKLNDAEDKNISEWKLE